MIVQILGGRIARGKGVSGEDASDKEEAAVWSNYMSPIINVPLLQHLMKDVAGLVPQCIEFRDDLNSIDDSTGRTSCAQHKESMLISSIKNHRLRMRTSSFV